MKQENAPCVCIQVQHFLTTVKLNRTGEWSGFSPILLIAFGVVNDLLWWKVWTSYMSHRTAASMRLKQKNLMM